MPVDSMAPLSSFREPFRLTMRSFNRFGAAACMVSWVYAAALCIILYGTKLPPAWADLIGGWAAIPVQALAIVMLLVQLRHGDADRLFTRRVCVYLAAFSALSMVATVAWNVFPLRQQTETMEFPDWIYITDYALLTIAFGSIFIHNRGSFRLSKTWLDVAAMFVALVVGIGSLFLGSSIRFTVFTSISVGAFVLYSLSIASTMTMGALLWLQPPTSESRLPLALLIFAGMADMIWEIMWLACWMTDKDVVGNFYNMGDVLCFTLLISSVAASRNRQSRSERPPVDTGTDEFFPVLALLVASALLAGSIGSAQGWEAWIMVGLVFVAALLFVARQRAARRAIGALNDELIKQRADARVLELVRQSRDVIFLLAGDGTVQFASPAITGLLGVSPEAAHLKPISRLFGKECETAIESLMARLHSSTTPLTIELRLASPALPVRIVSFTAANHLKNPLIHGIIVSVADVTEHRTVEKAILDAIMQERVRLSAEIHDGLAQDLVGVGLLLQALAANPTLAPPMARAELRDVIEHMDQLINSTRTLARGLSPISVVRGSLSSAIHRLMVDRKEALNMTLDVADDFDDQLVGDHCAEHIYRITQEAIQNAIRHSGARNLCVRLRHSGDRLRLEIADDGRGFERTAIPGGLGIRLMEYRALLLHGTLDIHQGAVAGTVVRFDVPTAFVAPAAAQSAHHCL